MSSSRPADRKFLTRLLESDGHEVLGATDGDEALSLVSRTQPDLVISDILMPTVDGFELVRRLRENRALAETRVIFYTATYHEREAQSLARQCGVVDILTKPGDPQAILDKINAALGCGPSLHATSRRCFGFQRASTSSRSGVLIGLLM